MAELDGEFQALYAREGRPAIPPEKLLLALLLPVCYTIRSARLLMEQPRFIREFARHKSAEIVLI